jgi:hypothetical protein
MIKKLLHPGPVHLSAPLRNCSIIVSPRPKRPPLFPTASDAVTRYSRIAPIEPPDHLATDMETAVTVKLIGLTDPSEIFEVYRDAFDEIIAHFRSHARPLIAVKSGYDHLLEEMRLSLAQFQENQKEGPIDQRAVEANLEAEKAKSDRKSERILEHLNLVRDLIADLRSEHADLRGKASADAPNGGRSGGEDCRESTRD